MAPSIPALLQIIHRAPARYYWPLLSNRVGSHVEWGHPRRSHECLL